jgi:hypothetical protein
MRRALSLSLASLALLFVPSLAWFSGCTSDDAADADGGDASDDLSPMRPDAGVDTGLGYCDDDVYTGGPCEPIEPDKTYCAPECEGGSGGCSCIQDPKVSTTKGIWSCVAATCTGKPACAPADDDCDLEGGGFVDTGPIPDTFVPPDTTIDVGAPDTTLH